MSFDWLSSEVSASLPDPVAASLAVISLQARRYTAAVLSGETGRALGEALSLQRECARLGDWARLAGWHADKHGGEALSAGGAAQPRGEGAPPLLTDAAERARICGEGVVW